MSLGPRSPLTVPEPLRRAEPPSGKSIDWSRYDVLSARWREASLAYVRAMNECLARADRGEEPGTLPVDTRSEMAAAVLAVVTDANAVMRETQDDRVIAELRRRFPPAHEPFIPHITEHAVPICNVRWSLRDRVCAALDSPERRDGMLEFHLHRPVEAIQGVLAMARAPDRNLFLLAHRDRLRVVSRSGAPVRRFRIPSGREGIDHAAITPIVRPNYLDLALLPDGQGALVVVPEGVFVCRETEVTRLFPDAGVVRERISDGCLPRFAMIHAALSPDGALVVVGDQDSRHHLMTIEGRTIASFDPVSDYPHHAAFTPDGRHVLATSCHMFHGITVAAAIDAPLDAPRRTVARGARLTSACFLGDDVFVVGDRGGYLRAYGLDGAVRWQHACGGAILGIDSSDDGRRLAVGTAAGYLQIIELDAETADPFQIGTATHRERARFIRWKGSGLLRW